MQAVRIRWEHDGFTREGDSSLDVDAVRPAQATYGFGKKNQIKESNRIIAPVESRKDEALKAVGLKEAPSIPLKLDSSKNRL